MSRRDDTAAAARDRSLRRVSAASWALGLGAASLTGVFSVVAAHAFKGHDGRKTSTATRATSGQTASAHVSVPPPQHVPAIVAQPLQAPEQAPSTPAPAQPAPAAPTQSAPVQPAPAQPAPAPAPPPVSSGGS